MELIVSSWPEVAAYLETRHSLIMPIGSTEQHGPTGLLGTDAICAEAIGLEVGRLTGALVAPTINVGMAQHHLAFPGTVSLRPTTLVALIVDYVTSLRLHGFNRFFFVNAHGGNTVPVKTAFVEIYAQVSFGHSERNADVRCELRNWWEAPTAAALAAKLYGDAEGAHATASEIAVTMHTHPLHHKTAVLNPKMAPPFNSFTTAADYRRQYPDGRIGSDPSVSRSEHGKEFFELAAQDLARDFLEFEGVR